MNTLSEILENALHTTPVWQAEPAFDPTMEQFVGIKAITYDGLGKTSTFAYMGLPEGATPDKPVPGIVLVHGGGGIAFLPWVKMWMDRGFAAIAMSTRGMFPAGVNSGRVVDEIGCHYGMYDSFVKPGYVDSPNEDGMKNADLPIEERWMTHALVKAIHAHNLLRSLPEVDNSRIGITGISWGGNITSIVITHDTRFAFAIPVYGSGYLSEALSYMGDVFSMPGNAPYRAEDRFDRVKIPVMWVAWNDDCAFSVNSNSKSYLATVPQNPKTGLALIHDMSHSHPCGWAPPVIAAFAHWVAQDGQPLVTFATQPEGRNANAALNIPEGVMDLEGTLYWIDSPMVYKNHDKYNYGNDTLYFMEQVWQTAPAVLKGNVLQAELPQQVGGYYLELRYKINGQDMVATSVYVAL